MVTEGAQLGGAASYFHVHGQGQLAAATSGGSEEGEEDAPGQPYGQVEVIRPAGLPDFAGLAAELEELGRSLADPAWLLKTPKESMIEMLSRMVPSFRHLETGQNLDTKL